MIHQLTDIRDVRHEPVAVLWASEARIYQRFGYGMATSRLVVEADKRNVRLDRVATPATGRLRDATLDEARKDLKIVYERLRPNRPGWSGRDDAWWSHTLHDPASRREGSTGPPGAAVRGPGRRRRVRDVADANRASTNTARPARSTSPRWWRPPRTRTSALWRFLFDVDLTRTVRYPFGAADEPLRLLADEPRALNTSLVDSLWLRVVDLPAALAARRYAAPVDVVLEVTDALLPANAGRWRLTGDGTSATCVATTDPRRPELRHRRAGRGLPGRHLPGDARRRRPGTRTATGCVGPGVDGVLLAHRTRRPRHLLTP